MLNLKSKEVKEFLDVLWQESVFHGLHECFDEFRETGEMWPAFELAAEQLLLCARKSADLALKYCNGPWNDFDQRADDANDDKIRQLARVFGVNIQIDGDPRGLTLKLKTPKTGRYNTLGGRETGWGIPGS